MNTSNWLIQDPAPGTHLLMFRGDTQSFTLSLSQPQKGKAWLRTNIGHAETTRAEIIKEVHNQEPPLGRGWFDIPMTRMDNGHFRIVLPLCEVGHFEAKCFFLREGQSIPVWPEGSNIVVNVEPADTCCANIIYNAFVRQFGPNKRSNQSDPTKENLIQTLDKKGYTVIPPSGTFRDLIQELDFIIGKLGCRIIQLLPIHPTPTTYGRMGRFGSPFAALSFTTVEPALAQFDPKTTPLEQFIELVDAVHHRNAKIFIDIAINHTGWAATIHETNPHWLVRGPDGKIEVPGAWGVRWEDLTKLDYTKKDLWQYMADIFLTWCRRGVDGFRCDAGYMIPVAAWKYIVAQVRKQFPDTIFLLEGLGGKISVTRDILNLANLNWTYSELFQNYDRNQIENYLLEAINISQSEGITVHFAETHDNPRLAARSKTYAKMRTALCALFSLQGSFGFANGVEWLAAEKINVHESPSINWGATDNQVDQIERISNLLKHHPAFHDQVELKTVQQGDGNHIALLRHHRPSGKKLLIVVNLDDEQKTPGAWNIKQTGMKGSNFIDLISGDNIVVAESHEQHTYLLEPGQALCLTPDQNDVDFVTQANAQTSLFPERIKRQCLRAKALDIHTYYRGTVDLGPFEPDHAAQLLTEDPVKYCQDLNPFSDEPRVIIWQWPQDINREVMIPPNHFLMVRSDTSFRAQIIDKDRCLSHEESLPCTDGSFFSLFSPLAPPKAHRSLTLKLSVYTQKKTQNAKGPLLFLSHPEDARIKKTYYRQDLSDRSLLFLGTNGRGGMLRARASWGELASRYDALLAANMDSELPEDRWIMLTRCRAWLVFQGYSQEICFDCLASFSFENNSRGLWRFQVPTGQGEHVMLTICVEMIPGKNSLRMIFSRDSANDSNGRLADQEQVRLILRPDIENRNFHDTTKAYQGPEHLWPEMVKLEPYGFTFAPDQKHNLSLQMPESSFEWEPEWQYMEHRPIEAERGLDPDSDLFSPGYFSAYLKKGQSLELAARITGPQEQDAPNPNASFREIESEVFENNVPYKMDEALKMTLDHFVVKRKTLSTVIAGYPWFLDWGRDALIFVRGLIASGNTKKARSILKQFGQFEEYGTLPNMIQGNNAKNRDTSDAPLWFFIACTDLVHREGNDDFLDTPCGDRTVRQVLSSIGHSYTTGTPNGIKMDPDSGLIFSPAHFTWMDTNYPAGTPRQGYPIEIQALWYAALTFLARIDPAGDTGNWQHKALQVQTSILDLYLLKKWSYLSDCLHADPGMPARQAEPDDALRPNQLLAVSLEAVTETTVCRIIVEACAELLVPGGIRSLADRPVERPLAINYHEKIINNPLNPYQGKYVGDEDTKRKPAYHNGTAWTWMLPSFCEAWVKAFGEGGKKTALSWLASCTTKINQGCVGHVPEIMDGDFPHKQRGCDAQAWGVSELLRVWLKLKGNNVYI